MVYPWVKFNRTARVNILQHMDFMFLKGQLKLTVKLGKMQQQEN
jgi:hypothetical protein